HGRGGHRHSASEQRRGSEGVRRPEARGHGHSRRDHRALPENAGGLQGPAAARVPRVAPAHAHRQDAPQGARSGRESEAHDRRPGVSVGERERATLARVVETFCPGAPSRAVADTIVAELEAVDRPKLVADLVLFLRVIERRTANLVLAGRPRPFSAMTRHERESYLISWGESALPPRRAAFQAAKRLSLFVAYSRSDGAANPLWAGTGYAPPALDPPAQPMLSARAVSAGEVIAADAVVVGSGAGGGVAAAELAAAGRHVLVLEQGALATEDEFEGREDRGGAGGHCGYGCRRGAKQSTMRTYLADALATGAELVARCHADRIAVAHGAAAGVEATCADGSRITVRAPLVVLAGGAIGTPALL